MNITSSNGVEEFRVCDNIGQFGRNQTVNNLWALGLVAVCEDEQDVSMWQSSFLVLFHACECNDLAETVVLKKVSKKLLKLDMENPHADIRPVPRFFVCKQRGFDLWPGWVTSERDKK